MGGGPEVWVQGRGVQETEAEPPPVRLKQVWQQPAGLGVWGRERWSWPPQVPGEGQPPHLRL